MYHIVGNSNTELGIYISQWYSEKVNRPVYAPFSCIGFLDSEGYIQAATIFEGYNGANINIHVYAPRYITLYNLKIVLNYVFNDLKCTRITAISKRSNKNLLKILPRLNFKFEGVLKNYFGDSDKDDGIVYRIKAKEASKWIKIYGKQPVASVST